VIRTGLGASPRRLAGALELTCKRARSAAIRNEHRNACASAHAESARIRNDSGRHVGPAAGQSERLRNDGRAVRPGPNPQQVRNPQSAIDQR